MSSISATDIAMQVNTFRVKKGCVIPDPIFCCSHQWTLRNYFTTLGNYLQVTVRVSDTHTSKGKR